MPSTDTQQDAQQPTEGVAITAFGRLVLLRSQVDAALDDETADRQYALEQVLDELTRILDEARVNTATVASALTAGEVTR